MFILCFLYLLTGSIFYLLFTTEVTLADNDLFALRLTIFLVMLPLLVKYIVQFLSAPWYGFAEKRQLAKREETKTPSVSVLIPAWNEEVGILKTIQSVLNTQYADLELIIINDGSSDQTHTLVTEFIAHYKDSLAEHSQGVRSARIKYFKLPNGGKAKALNYGIEHATGELIITVDADSVMDKDAISRLIPRFNDPQVGAVAGNVIVGNRKKPLALLQQLEYLHGFFFKRADSLFNAVYIIGGAAAAYRSKVLAAVGGFDEKLITEDIEMSTRILSQGYKTRYAADAVVYTEGPSDWKGLCQQRLRWKYGRLLTFIKHRAMFFNPKIGNSYLSFLLLPVALYADLCLLLEALFLAVFYGYTVYTNDYLPLACVITFLSAFVCIQIACDSKARFHKNIICLAPVAWVLFYVIDAVECQALFRSLKRLAKRQKLEWQPWVRVGLLHKGIAPSSGFGHDAGRSPLESLTGSNSLNSSARQ